ncbi:glycosyltransferase [Streptomyces hirsutus]|uniref:D-inositol 3-phosphate glycosyltransferase n=1 Tax=Streptomyces hirsutus TaxID=35620 RepID=A0ABZ1GMS6_9ACTN|nr:glycosyltransferase [Streptomyces hirsutus]WSD06617.1 glycosyltransferase [Streptomyces hirsutus]
MDIAALRNPYDYRNPVRDVAVFAGRAEEVAAIGYELDQAALNQPSVCVVLHGPRAAGKTSLLNAAEWMAGTRRFIAVRVELIKGDGRPISFFRKVYEELAATFIVEVTQRGDTPPFDMATVRRVMAGAVAVPSEFPLEFPETVALAGPQGQVSESALRSDLSFFVKQLGHPLVLLIDEAQIAADDAQVLSVLRFLTLRVDGLVLVLAGTSGLIERITDVHSPILRQFKEIEVKGFVESEDVLNCVMRPLRKLGISGVDVNSTVSALRHLTDGNPYEIQLYCHEMFVRWQQGEADGMQLTPEVLEGIRSRMESGRDVIDRPLIRTVRRMKEHELIAFNVLSSALGHATADDAWFAYSMTGSSGITREQYDVCRESLVESGILAADEIIHFATETELFDEIYVRLWTISKLGQASHAQLTSRNDVRALMINRLFVLLHIFAQGPLRIFPTCCSRMNVRHIGEAFSALEKLPDEGPNSAPHVSLVHSAVLRAGEPRALDLTTVSCTYRGHSVKRWLYAADTDDISLADSPGFKKIADRIERLGGELTADRVRIPLRSWPATGWFRRAKGHVRPELADNHLQAAYAAYRVGDISTTRKHLETSFELAPEWESANNLLYVCSSSGLPAEALEWSDRAIGLAADTHRRSLSRYNTAMASLLNGNREEAAGQLYQAAGEMNELEVSDYRVDFLLLPECSDDVMTMREVKGVDLLKAVQQAQALIGDVPAVENRAEKRTKEQQADAVPSRRAPVVLAVATEWASSHGGLSTFNREMCRALAVAGAQVFCVVLTATANELAAAAATGVTLLPTPVMPGASEDMRLTSRPSLPSGTVPDVVVGHSRITGPAAKKLADDFFPSARRLHFVHMAPDEIEWYKLDRVTDAGLRAEERTDIERALGRSAHRVVAVGPRLHDQFLAEFAGFEAPPPLRIDPGFDAAPATHRTPPGGFPRRVLLLGRTEDAHLKGVDLAAAACGRVATWLDEDGLGRVRLLVRGAPDSVTEEQWAQIKQWSASAKLDVVVRAYSSDQERIDNDLNSSSLVIVPSRSEGYGLVAVEAISQGIPVLVSSETGFAQHLREAVGHEAAARFVVSMSGDDEKDTERWARAIERVLRDRENSFGQIAELRGSLAKKVTWTQAASIVLGERRNVSE